MLQRPGGPADACPTPYACWSAILLARSLVALERSDQAEQLLSAIEDRARALRLASLWEEAADDLRGARR